MTNFMLNSNCFHLTVCLFLWYTVCKSWHFRCVHR